MLVGELVRGIGLEENAEVEDLRWGAAVVATGAIVRVVVEELGEEDGDVVVVVVVFGVDVVDASVGGEGESWVKSRAIGCVGDADVEGSVMVYSSNVAYEAGMGGWEIEWVNAEGRGVSTA